MGNMIPPPTIAIHKSPDILGFRSPCPSNEVVNMVGNMIELNRPTASKDHIDSNPLVKTLSKIKVIAVNPKTERIRVGLNILVK